MDISKNIRLKRGQHRDKEVIWLVFDKQPEWLKKVKTLSSVKYSATLGRWYIPYDLDGLNAFVRLGLPYTLSGAHASTHKVVYDVPASGRGDTSIVSPERDDIRSPSTGKEVQDIQEDIHLSWSGSGIVIKLAYDETEVRFVKSLQGAYWHPKYQNWICKPSKYNLDRIQERWQLLDAPTYSSWQEKILHLSNKHKVVVFRTPRHAGRICVELIGHGANHQLLRKGVSCEYHKALKYYTTPASWDELSEIISVYRDMGYHVDNRLEECHSKRSDSLTERVERSLATLPKKNYGSLKQVTDAMIRMNYGYNTIKAYSHKLCGLMSYAEKTELGTITTDEVSAYINELLKSQVSYSTINTVHSAIRLYHLKVVHVETFDIQRLERPRKKRALPTILSEKEVWRIIEQVSNIKHLAIVYMLYGSGLRRGEVINLQLSDIMWDRNQIHIKNGKGQKDRVLPMGRYLKRVLQEYLDVYRPATYVFESTELGKAYSGSSISKILRDAVKKAGISKRVTPHVFRHAFATHLIDQGTAVPKVQALLGHKDISTTMIYTHFTMDDIQKVTSPLERILSEKVTTDNEKM